MHDMSQNQQFFNRNLELMCLAEGIAPIGGEVDDMPVDDKLAALALPNTFSELITDLSGIRVELVPDDHQGNADRVMAVLDALNGHARHFEIVVGEDAAFLSPTR